jgi:hypothetical protein
MSNPCKKGDCDFDVVSNNSMAKVHKIVVNIALCKMKIFISTHVLDFGILQKMKIGHMVGQHPDDFWDNKIDNGNLFFKISTLSSDESSGMAEVSIDFTKYMQFHMYIMDDRVLKATDFFCKCNQDGVTYKVGQWRDGPVLPSTESKDEPACYGTEGADYINDCVDPLGTDCSAMSLEDKKANAQADWSNSGKLGSETASVNCEPDLDMFDKNTKDTTKPPWKSVSNALENITGDQIMVHYSDVGFVSTDFVYNSLYVDTANFQSKVITKSSEEALLIIRYNDPDGSNTKIEDSKVKEYYIVNATVKQCLPGEDSESCSNKLIMYDGSNA